MRDLRSEIPPFVYDNTARSKKDNGEGNMATHTLEEVLKRGRENISIQVVAEVLVGKGRVAARPGTWRQRAVLQAPFIFVQGTATAPSDRMDVMTISMQRHPSGLSLLTEDGEV